jgi:hypothetical protein
MGGRLLLKADGVICERWNPVEDGPPPEIVPATWDAVHVGRRFANALVLLSKMPARIFPRGHANVWPTYRLEWVDLLSMLGDEAGTAIKLLHAERNFVRIPPSSLEISHMEAALGWQADYLRGRDSMLARAFNICGLAAARDCGIDDIVQHRWDFPDKGAVGVSDRPVGGPVSRAVAPRP